MREFKLGIHNCYLPEWLHRLCNGIYSSVLCFTIATAGLVYCQSYKLLYILSLCLYYLTIPVGILAAIFVNRFSIVEGCAGEDGYDELISEDGENNKA
ncbi:MAG: hypothetical protein ACE14V_01975 [bacterium]